jgi:hypothetical protein
VGLVYQGFLGGGFSDFLSPGQIDSFSISLSVGISYYLDVVSESAPLDIAVGGLLGTLGPYEFVGTGAEVFFSPTATGVYGIGIDTSSGGSGFYSITIHSKVNVIPTPTPVPTPIPTPVAVPVVLHGSHDQYIVASNNGSLYVQDKVVGRDGTQTLPGTNIMSFTDGSGVYDPTGTAEDVARLYQAALSRAPDVDGLRTWTSYVDNSHVPLSAVANSFATSPEFVQTYGSLSDDGFVQRLYQNTLGRSADVDGERSWDGALASGTSRGAVTLSFAECPENKGKMLATTGDADNAEVYRLYQAAFHRPAEFAGENFWSSVLASGSTPTQIAQNFIGSAEFQNDYGPLSSSDFVSTLYQNVLHRIADAAGLQYWTSTLQAGSSEASVLVGFSDSLEDRVQTAGATHADWVFVAK